MRALGIDAGSCRLVQALFRPQAMVDHLEWTGGGPVVLARRPVGLVRDNEVHASQPVLLLRRADPVQRLVGREYGHHALLHAVQTVGQVIDPLGDGGGIGGDGRFDLGNEACKSCGRSASAFVFVRTHHHRAHRAFGVCQPGTARLAGERDARRGVDDEAAFGRDLLRHAQRHQRLAGTARHHQPATILVAEPLHAGAPGGLLVGVQFQRLGPPKIDGRNVAPFALGVDERTVRIVRVGGNRSAPLAGGHHPVGGQFPVPLRLEPELLEIVQHQAPLRVQALGLDGDQPAVVALG